MVKYTVGLDVGSSSVKAAIFNLDTDEIVGSYTSPVKKEMEIISLLGDTKEQDSELWWQHSKTAVKKALKNANVNGDDVEGIGVSYQMHGFQPVGSDGTALMNANIWCDGRTVEQKQRIETNDRLRELILKECLNLPGHFTASKIAWFKENEPALYDQMEYALLPGHYILRRATGNSTVTASGLSEGCLWDFKNMCLSDRVMKAFELDKKHIPEMKPTFGEHGRLTRKAAGELGLREDTPFTYFGGDQPNNAFSLNVLQPGEVAATAGTSAVIYGVDDKVTFDKKTRVNSFLHLNSSTEDHSNLRIGILGCVNGAGISYSFAKHELGGRDYDKMNELAASVQDTAGLTWVPYGNGPERTQLDSNTGAHLVGLDLGKHKKAHIYKAIQVGIVYAMKQAFDVMTDMGMDINTVRAGHANMFLSPLFRQTFADAMGVPVELYDTDGAAGAARAAAVGLGKYTTDNVYKNLDVKETIRPSGADLSKQYEAWTDVVQHMSK